MPADEIRRGPSARAVWIRLALMPVAAIGFFVLLLYLANMRDDTREPAAPANTGAATIR